MIGRSRKREEILVSPKLMPLGVSSSQGRCWKSVYYIKVLQSYKKAIPTLTLCAKNHLYPIIFCVEPAGKFQFSSPCVSDRPTCLTFFCSKMSKNAQWINKEYCFFIRQTEVQPDFAIAKIQHAPPEIQIFWAPNIAPPKFSTPPNVPSALCLWAFPCIFHNRKKVK